MSEESGDMSGRLGKILSDGGDWERTPTNIPGVMLIRMPPYRSRGATLAIEVNPLNSSGSTTKKQGFKIRSASELRQVVEIMANADVAKLAEAMDKVNPVVASSKQSSDVFKV